MRGRFNLSVLAAFALVSSLGAHARAAATPTADAIFARAKHAWHERRTLPFVEYGLLERYTWRAHTHDNWWHAAYRASDHALVLHRIIVAEAEQQRLRGTAFALHLRTHWGSARADTLETNPNADAFPVLDPQVDPDASFGLVRHAPHAELIGNAFLNEPTPQPSAAATATPLPSPSPSVAPGVPTEAPLRELVRVEAVARDYTIVLAGIDHVRAVEAYHLVLTPLREPNLYRLRDLWVDTSDYETVKLAVDGLFEGKPYDAARWTVTYVNFNGEPYVQQIKTDDTLRFGMDRYVAGLEYDFVQYAFPQTISPIEFTRLL
ncbi:MAG: hypothetical protein M3R44_06710 [Candidatus Eremiobacteraeota bacterium]|nr:hypothetical protein [Candidatus Eremiobacteraeota bacterium]